MDDTSDKGSLSSSPPPSPNPPSPRPTSTVAHRMFHPPKLERKHSSGDLHSRLKTRKILGVGETDNGDIHRSKISQLLGHNEHLYVKFPRGYWIWHLSMALTFTLLGLSNLFFPERGYDVMLGPKGATDLQSQLATRFYGCTSLAVAFLLWTFWGTMDKGVARSLMLAVALCHLLQAGAIVLTLWETERTWRGIIIVVIRLLLVLPNAYFHRNIGFCGLRMRKSTSFNNLKDCAYGSGKDFGSNNHFKKGE